LKSGSSPRLRGTHPSSRMYSPPRRFIPASAGNTGSLASSRYNTAVHPRVCGEHCLNAATGLYVIGSSPRLRGTLSLTP